MRRSILVSSDLFLVASATLLAIWLRADFDNVQDKLITLLPYILVTIGSASIVFLVSGLDRTPWRYSSVTDHLQIIVLTVLVILLTLGLTFAANRLEGVSRTLPVLQGGLIISILIFARAIARFWFATRIYKKGSGHLNTSAGETVLVVGVNAVAELYLVSLQEFASHRIQVAGIIAEDPTMRGRLIRQNAVLGTVDELPNVLQSLEIHGVTVDRIVVATAVDRLLPRALEALLEIEKSSNIVVHFLSDRLGFTNASEKPPIFPESERSIMDGQIPRSLVGDLANANFARKPFRLKRTVDSVGAAFLMVTLAPIAAVIAVIVALDVGFPLIFWQQRPGLCGQPFRMYKFRTMRAAHDKHGTRIADAQRSSAIGRILRSTRLDELPQLYNVLVGDMSFVGPRPLLPHEQHPNYAARLSVRPGITGWAQVNGGRIISDPDKWILDIWYVQNASLLVDFKIILGTVKLVLFGDRINAEAIRQAKSDLGLKTLLPAE